MTDFSPMEKETAVLDVADIPGMAESTVQTVPVVPEEEGSTVQFASVVQEDERSDAHQESVIQEDEGSAAHQESVIQEDEGSAAHQESVIQEDEGNAAHQESVIQEEDVKKMNWGATHTAFLATMNTAAVTKSGPKLEQNFSEQRDPPDGGWGWYIVFSGFLTLFVLTGISLSLATLLGAYLTELEAPAALGAWMFNVQSAVWCFAGLWAEPLGIKFSHRLVAALGAVLCAAAIMISAAIKNPYLFFITVSIMYGTGGGICVSCCFQMSRRYFSTRLGMANGLILCGGTLGVAMMSTLAGTLQYRMDFPHSTLAMGILPLIPAVTCFITFRPKAPYWESEEQQKEHESRFFHATALGGSHLVGATYVFPPRSSSCTTSAGESDTFRHHLISNFRLSAFLDRDVMAIAAMTGFTQFMMINVYTVSSYALKQANVSPSDLMVFLWVAGLTDLVSRLSCCFIVDHPDTDIQCLYTFGQLLFMIMTLMMAFFRQSWAVVLTCAAGFGMSLGIMYVLDLLLMIHFFGNEKFQSVFGVCMVFRSCCSLVIGPIGGLIRELCQSYTPTFLFYVGILFFAFVISIHYIIFKKDDEQREPSNQSSS